MKIVWNYWKIVSKIFFIFIFLNNFIKILLALILSNISFKTILWKLFKHCCYQIFLISKYCCEYEWILFLFLFITICYKICLHEFLLSQHISLIITCCLSKHAGQQFQFLLTIIYIFHNMWSISFNISHHDDPLTQIVSPRQALRISLKLCVMDFLSSCRRSWT